MYEYHYKNIFYAEGKDTGIKYSWNQGYINIDNPKLAARYFLNAIDRVEHLKEKYEKQLKELEQNIPMMQQIIARPFQKEDELSKMKTDVSNLEREITIKIQANQMKQQNAVPENAAEIKETPVIKMEINESKKAKPENTLLIKKNLPKERVAA